MTSVSLTVRQIAWLREHARNRSDLFRRLLDAYIEDVEGFGVSIQLLEAEREELMRRVCDIDTRLEGMREQQESFLAEEDRDREARIRRLREELNVG